MQCFTKCFDWLAVPIAAEKTDGPAEIIVFLGLEIDSVLMQVRIPQEKITEVVTKIKHVLSVHKTTLRDMQSLIGSLNFCCRAIILGRPFCHPLINSICGLTKPHHHLRVKKGMKLDLQMWLKFFENFNGISVFHDRFWVSNVDEELYTDSAGGKGFGVYCNGHWACADWPPAWHAKGITADITTLELFPIYVSLCMWGKYLSNKKLKFMCDNMAVVVIINSMTSKSETVMIILHEITEICLWYNIFIKACHVPGTRNKLCDALSLFQIRKFKQLAPQADSDPHLIPDFLWEIFS